MADELTEDNKNATLDFIKNQDFPPKPQSTLFHTVIHLVDDNILHFHEDESEQGQRLYSGLRALRDGLIRIISAEEILQKEASKYDFSPESPGNGLRSFCGMVQQTLLCIFELCKKISTNRDSIILFRKGHYVKEIEAWGQTTASLSSLLDYITNELLPRCENGNLMPEMDCSTSELMSLLNTVSQYSFYGRCLGFHYYESLQKTLKFLSISMCAFSEVYYSDGGFMTRTKQSLLTGGKYVLNPEQRARRIVDVVQYSSVDFIKAFWSLADTELLTQLPGIVCPTLNVHQSVILPCEDIEVLTVDDRLILIPAPQSHIPACPISCYLLSAFMREGMPGENQHKGPVFPPSDKIIFHCHGGGFVTQSTKAQEVFLREWAMAVGVPIFSVDYSLAPEARYPRPLEEVLVAYVWMLKNFKILGTTGTKIVLTGDSAGGNLVTALTIRCLELRIRPPNGLFLIYTPFNVKIMPTPARLLSVCDPMLPLGFALRCLKAYAGLPSNTTSVVNSPTDGSSSWVSPSSTLETTSDHSEENCTDVPRIQSALTPEISSKNDKATNQSKSPHKASPPECKEIPLMQRQKLDPQVPPSVLKKMAPSIKNTLQSPAVVPMKADGVASDNESFVEVTENDVVEATQSMVKSRSFVSEPETDTMTTVSLTSDPTSSAKVEVASTRAASHAVPDAGTGTPEKETREERSKKYVSEFLEKYVLDSKVDKQGRKIPILRTGSEEMDDDNVVYEASSIGSGITAKLGKAKEAVLGGISAGLTSLKFRGKNVASPLPNSPSKSPSPTGVKVKRTPSIGRISLGTSKLRRENSFSLLEEFMGVEVFNDHYISPINAPHDILAQFPPTSILTVEYDFCLDDCVSMGRLLRSLNVPVTFDVIERLPHGFLNLSLVSKEAHDGCKLVIARLRSLFGIEDDEVKESPAHG